MNNDQNSLFGELEVSTSMCQFLFNVSYSDFEDLGSHFDPRLRPLVIVLYMRLMKYFLEFSNIYRILKEYSLRHNDLDFWQKVKNTKVDNSSSIILEDIQIFKEAIELFSSTRDALPKKDVCCPPQIYTSCSETPRTGQVLSLLYKYDVVLDKENVSILVLANHLLKFKNKEYPFVVYSNDNRMVEYIQDQEEAVWNDLFQYWF